MNPKLQTRRWLVSALLTALSFFGLSTALLSRQALVASAGPDQTGVFVGSVVNLTGAGSVGATTYAWTFLSRPAGSAAVLLNPATVTPSFVPQRAANCAWRAANSSTAGRSISRATNRNLALPTVQWTGGRMLFQAGNNTLVNETDGSWNVGAGTFDMVGSAGHAFTNAGLLKGTGAGTTTLNISAGISFTPGTTADITIVH